MPTYGDARVSTIEQTLDHQRTQAEKAGFDIDAVVADHGVSGISTKFAERRAALPKTLSGPSRPISIVMRCFPAISIVKWVNSACSA